MFQAIKAVPIENNEVWLCPVKNRIKAVGQEKRRGEVVIAMVGRGDQSNCRILQVDVRARRPALRGRSNSRELVGEQLSSLAAKQPYARSSPSTPPPLAPPAKAPGAKGGQAVMGAGLRPKPKLGDCPWCFYARKAVLCAEPFFAAGRSWTWRILRLCGEFRTHRTACAVPLGSSLEPTGRLAPFRLHFSKG